MLGLIYIPTIAKISGWNALSFFAQLSSIDFPLVLKCLASIFIAFGLFLAVYAATVLSPKGELKKVYFQSLTFVRKGPYKVIRHPAGFGSILLFVLHPIALSGIISYTILAVIAQIGLVIILVASNIQEEKVNLRKWGDEYR